MEEVAPDDLEVWDECAWEDAVESISQSARVDLEPLMRPPLSKAPEEPRPTTTHPLEKQFPHPHPNVPVGGRLTHFASEWRQITKNRWVLDVIENGLKLDLNAVPCQEQFPRVYQQSSEIQDQLHVELHALTRKNAAIQIEMPDQPQMGEFYSPAFLLKQKTKSRPIFDYRGPNAEIPSVKFKMETMKDVIDLLIPNGWMGKIDIEDAYLHIPVAPEDRPMLRIVSDVGCFEPKVALFGLSNVPRVFTKVVKEVVLVLRWKGICIIAYLDDMLVVAESKEKCRQDLVECLTLFQKLGFKIKWSKCVLEPTQVIEYLGWELDLRSMTMRVPKPKLKQAKKEIRRFAQLKSATLRRTASILGKLNSLTPAFQCLQLFTRRLQQVYNHHISEHRAVWERRIRLPVEVKEDLTQLLQNIEDWNGHSMIPLQPDLIVHTDACLTGWGGNVHWKGVLARVKAPWRLSDVLPYFEEVHHAEIRRTWYKDQLTPKVHISFLEILAVLYSFRALEETWGVVWKDKTVLCQVDNVATAVYISKVGGTKSVEMNKVALDLWKFVQERNMKVRAHYIPGATNTEADYDSRTTDGPVDWLLNPTIFHQIDKVWGPHSIDLFASRSCHQIERYVSWSEDPQATAVDAFRMAWKHENPWIVPFPFVLVGRILQKICQEKVTATIVVPHWPSAPWYPQLLGLLIDCPILIVHHQHTIITPNRDQQIGPTSWHRSLACRISGDDSQVKAFQRRCSSIMWPRSGNPQTNNTTPPFRDMFAGVKNGILIPWNRMLIK